MVIFFLKVPFRIWKNGAQRPKTCCLNRGIFPQRKIGHAGLDNGQGLEK